MANISQNGSRPALQSDWSGLSEHLLATFFAVNKVLSDDAKKVIRWERDMSQPEVIAPITDTDISITANWQSPFENMSPDQQFSSLSSMLQAGGFTSLLSHLQGVLPPGMGDEALKASSELEGRSNLTKLNSTQVFSGMPPLRLPVTAHFRAFSNASQEVAAPVDQLAQWALPKSISEDGVIGNALQGRPGLFPSEVPQIIGMKYAGRIYSPLVIEELSMPLSGPRDRFGNLTSASVVMQISTLTAIDRNDWSGYSSNSSRKNFGY